MRRKKLLACLLAVILCFGVLPAAALAEEPEAEPVKPDSDAFDFVEGAALDRFQLIASELPSSYDLRHVPTEDGGEVSYVTPVRVQNPYGTCWGFAVIAAAESSLLSSGLAAQYGYDADTLDLSEKQIAYFAASTINDPASSQYGEGLYFRNLSKLDALSSAYRYNFGGFSSMATSMFAQGVGPTLERVFDESGELVENDFAYKGANGEAAYWVVPTQYDDEGQPVESSYHLEPLWYSDQDDWSMPESYRYVQSFQLKESIVLPDPSGVNEKGEYEFNAKAVDAIKQQIAQYHRAVNIGFTAESYLPGQNTDGKLFMSENWAHYTNVRSNTNHAVTIVGYDDHYPKESFNSTTENGGRAQPEGDGAFLVKNSWGSELNEFPNNAYRHWGLLDGLDGVPYDANAKPKAGNKASGYFWISYYDRSIGDPEAFVFEAPSGANGCYIEQMDMTNCQMIIDKRSDSVTKMANVFTAKATAKLDAFSVMTTTPGTKVDYAVYLLGKGYKDPTDGILIETGTCSFEYGGYHRVTLNSPRVLTKWQQYSVVIEETAETDHYVCCALYGNLKSDDIYCVTVINPGESFYYSDGAWGDLSDSETNLAVSSEYDMYRDHGYEILIDNFPIKSYLTPITYPNGGENPVFDGYLSINHWMERNPDAFNVAVGESKELTAEFRGLEKDMPGSWDPSFEWAAADDSLLSVSTNAPKKGHAVITGLKPGVTQLIICAGDGDYDRSHPYPDNYGVRVLTIVVYAGPEILEDGSLLYEVSEEEAAAGTAILPTLVYSADSSESASLIRVTVPEAYPSVRLEIPVNHIAACDILILVHPDGTEEILPDVAMTDTGLRITLDGDTVLKQVTIVKEYEDVDRAYEHKEAISFVAARGLMNGVSETEFAPEETLSRAMAATVLYRLTRQPVVDAASDFRDVAADSWYSDAISWASANGVVEGYGKTFGINDPVTREQLVAMLWRLRGKPAAAKVRTGASDWAAEAMSWAAEVGVIERDADGFRAGDPATRIEAAEMLMRYINL